MNDCKIKPNTANEEVLGDYDLINGGESTILAGFRTANPGVAAAVLDASPPYTALFGLFHGEGAPLKISYNTSRAIVLIHEAIHLLGFHDTNFGPTQQAGSQNLTTLIIQSCVNRNYTFRDLSIVPH